MKTKIIFTLILLLTGWTASESMASGTSIDASRSRRLTGRVTDEVSTLPVGNVSVALHSSTDSSLVAGTITNYEGNFCISATDPGNSYLVFNYEGYTQKAISLSGRHDYTSSIALGLVSLTRREPDFTTSRKRFNNK
jgi:hypothetical protein